MDPIKAEQLTSVKWRVLAIPFGGPLKGGKDTDHEYFSARTDIKPDWFPQRPVIFHHGKDATVEDETLGTEDDLKLDDRLGWWATMWLNRQSDYFAFLEDMMQQGKAFGSSGPIAHLVKKDAKTGEILRWPHAEQSITLTPANIFSRVSAAKMADHFTTAGIELDPVVKGLLMADISDLGPDLPIGGDDPAMARLRKDVALLLARSQTI